LDYIATELEKATKGNPGKLNSAIQKLLKEIITDHGAVVFNGDGYSEAWHKEAAKRGLPNLKTTIDAMKGMANKQTVELFSKYKVLNKREVESRHDIYLEQYCKTINVEANLVVKMAKTIIYPCATRYQGQLAATAASLKAAGQKVDASVLSKVSGLIQDLEDSVAELDKIRSHHAKDLESEAEHYCDEVLPAMLEVRKVADRLESIVADDLWSLPTYQEMLFIK
jgi:glutamine synthetase